MLNSFCGGMSKLDAKSDADLLLYSRSHFECNGHTGHTLTQGLLPPPLTNKYSEVVIVHTCASQSTLLGCQVTSMSHKHSHYIHNGWTFSEETLCVIYVNDKLKRKNTHEPTTQISTYHYCFVYSTRVCDPLHLLLSPEVSFILKFEFVILLLM